MLAIDQDIERVDEIKNRVTIAVRLNVTNEKALAAQGVSDMDAAVGLYRRKFRIQFVGDSPFKKIGRQTRHHSRRSFHRTTDFERNRSGTN